MLSYNKTTLIDIVSPLLIHMKQVLHLEDNLEYQEQVKSLIQGTQSQINSLTNLTDAINAFNQVTPDLVITDYCLVPQTKNRDGLEFVRYIRKRDLQTPIIMYSSGERHILEMVLEAGVNDFIQKDDIPNLRKILTGYLGGKNGLCV